jgi:hypothetical protein
VVVAKTLKEYTFSRHEQLKKDRNEYEYDWRELADFVLGNRGQFLVNERDTDTRKKGSRRNERLYNETAKQAADILSAGMMAGITSPARPWFKLGTPDPELQEFAPVKLWLDDVQRILLQIFARSNFYNAMQNVYLELGTFGTHSMGAYEQFENVMRFEPYTIGSYWLAQNGEREVDTQYREYQIPVGAAAKMFGKEQLSKAAQQVCDRGNIDTRIGILHAIEPNDERRFDSPFAQDMPYRSVYYEKDDSRKDHALKVSGFNEKAFMAPRWSAVGEDVYASACPGLDSLASNKSLQIEELDKAIAIEKMHNPPLVGDTVLRQAGVDQIAGGITYVPGMMNGAKPGLSSVYDVNPRIAELMEDIREKENRIQRFFYVDLFLMVTEMDRAQITAIRS